MQISVRTKPCPGCGETSDLLVDKAAFEAWKNGRFVQDAFPQWSPEQRELLITGFHSKCWDEAFKEEDEEGYEEG